MKKRTLLLWSAFWILMLFAFLFSSCQKTPTLNINAIEYKGNYLIPFLDNAEIQSYINSRDNEGLLFFRLRPIENVIGTSPVNTSVITKERLLVPNSSGIYDGVINGQSVNVMTDGSLFLQYPIQYLLDNPDVYNVAINNYQFYFQDTFNTTEILLAELAALADIVSSQVTTNFFIFPSSIAVIDGGMWVSGYSLLFMGQDQLAGHVRFNTINNRLFSPYIISSVGGCNDYQTDFWHDGLSRTLIACDFETPGLSVKMQWEPGQ
jgi:hypothetical protein